MGSTVIMWYENGYWPLVGTIAVLLLTNGITVYQVLAGAKKQFDYSVKLRRIENFEEQLSKFYNPLLTFLKANSEIFDSYGPASFKNAAEHEKRSAAMAWKDFREIILTNNEAISSLLVSQSHNISETDDLVEYLQLYLHVISYRRFVERPTDTYANFMFPSAIVAHVEAARSEVVARIRAERR